MVAAGAAAIVLTGERAFSQLGEGIALFRLLSQQLMSRMLVTIGGTHHSTRATYQKEHGITRINEL